MKRARKSPDYPSVSGWKYITIDEYCTSTSDDDLCTDRDGDPVMETDACPAADPVDPADVV